MKKAYSYQRFSSIKQRDGDSLKRQTEAAKAFCRQFNLQLVLTLKDEGVSGFKGKNFSNESALGHFLKLVENGTVELGSVLIVENMDRLSRQSILPCLSKFIEIIEKGVSIGVISQNKILDQQSITANPMELMLVLVEFARANNESQTKSVRAKSVVQAKVERMKQGEKVWFGSFEPTWITGLKDGKFTTDEKRIKLVQSIFKQYLAGDSCSKVADELNRSKTPTLRGLTNGIWTNVTVAELLRNKNVIGWCGINGNEFEDYYPSIVSAKDYQAAQQKLAFNVKSRGGSKYGLVRNLFKGMLFCAECGQAIETKIGTFNNAQGGINHYAHYICRGVKQKTGCKNKGRVPVSIVELAVFENVLFKHPSQITQQETKGKGLVELEDQQAKIQVVIDRLTDMASDVDLKDVSGLKAKLKEAVADKEAIGAQIKAANAKAGQLEAMPAATSTLNSLFNFGKVNYAKDAEKWINDYAKFNANQDNRKKLRNLMSSIFDRITLKFISTLNASVTDITCTLVSGEVVNAKVAKTAKGIVIPMNDPKTKKPAPFKILKDGTKIPVN